MSLSSDLLPGVPLIESPLFDQSLDVFADHPGDLAVARQLRRDGYAVIDFPDPDFAARIDRIRSNLGPRYGVDVSDPDAIADAANLRIQDAWAFDPDVKAIAENPAILALLSRLWGRRAFPFQTLNFPVGTQQHLHSDSIHFSSQPERFMCGVWVALEDVHADAGPLLYCPGSHRWPIVTNAMIGRSGWNEDRASSAQGPFEGAWRALVAANGTATETFLARKGQALIWAANLLHGGEPRHDPRLTRWSQVSHYYFEDCLYYTPAFSDEALGRLDLRTITNIATGQIEPNRMLGEIVAPVQARREVTDGKGIRGTLMSRIFGQRAPDRSALPGDFDGEAYLRLHPDVARGGMSAAEHYLAHGRFEGRRYRDT